ncbi:hypothetical protein M885DRAFT_532309 [Pelagophyceae sp. CCMP2097]|nr:hypothetical protein M885DRAFT_532309 [Pelagophyceae sp. CCMP2097]
MRCLAVALALALRGACGLKPVRRRAVVGPLVAAVALPVARCDAVDVAQLVPAAAPTLDPADVYYPSALEGAWRCTVKRTLVEGDVSAAEAAWRGLGGSGDFKALTEGFDTRFVRVYDGVILDRSYELESRLGRGAVSAWSKAPDAAITFKGGMIKVVQRTSERVKRVKEGDSQSAAGAGFDEVFLLTDSNGFERQARVRRKLKPNGNDSIDGLEILTTFRVLDGVAGDLPTSTTKTRIRYDRL